MKQTKQKEAILNKVRQMHTHPSANEIYQALKQDGQNISLATVYRNLSKFSELGAIKKVEIFDLSDRFDYRIDEHQHLLCENCGRVFDVDVSVSLDFKDRAPQISSYKILFSGICENCKMAFCSLNDAAEDAVND